MESLSLMQRLTARKQRRDLGEPDSDTKSLSHDDLNDGSDAENRTGNRRPARAAGDGRLDRLAKQLVSVSLQDRSVLRQRTPGFCRCCSCSPLMAEG